MCLKFKLLLIFTNSPYNLKKTNKITLNLQNFVFTYLSGGNVTKRWNHHIHTLHVIIFEVKVILAWENSLSDLA